MSNLIECTNPACKKEYIAEDKKTDDGFCSLECWEALHCSAPKESADIFEVTTESLLRA